MVDLTNACLTEALSRVPYADPPSGVYVGEVETAVGLLVEVRGLPCRVGQLCYIDAASGDHVPCEVVGFNAGKHYLMPLGSLHGIHPGCAVRVPATEAELLLPAAEHLLGRVVDGLLRPLDNGEWTPHTHVWNPPVSINPMRRQPIDTLLDCGVAGINGLLSVGVGQRMGLFAGSGVGKSVLLGMLARFVAADVVVVGLIGERGREVAEFVADQIGDSLPKTVVIASPGDDSAAMRLRAARATHRVAEQFAAAGKQVLLLFDSLTRVAQAQREIGLALGEPPSSKGYTPSSFALLPELVERAGPGSSAEAGSITAFYTVLMEEDDLQDPIVDAARAILDGQIVLSRKIAEQGLFPAIDIGSSISRLMTRLVAPEQLRAAQEFRQLWQCYAEQQDFISIGAYQGGSDPLTDRAIELLEPMRGFLRQAQDERVDLVHSQSRLTELLQSRAAAALVDPALIQVGAE